MLKLYGNISGWQKIGEYRDNEEDKLKTKLTSYFMKYDHIEYIIVSNECDTYTILSEEDYYNYMNETKEQEQIQVRKRSLYG